MLQKTFYSEIRAAKKPTFPGGSLANIRRQRSNIILRIRCRQVSGTGILANVRKLGLQL